jgi:hypothetical protein
MRAWGPGPGVAVSFWGHGPIGRATTDALMTQPTTYAEKSSPWWRHATILVMISNAPPMPARVTSGEPSPGDVEAAAPPGGLTRLTYDEATDRAS